jgi:hypothetical protein
MSAAVTTRNPARLQETATSTWRHLSRCKYSTFDVVSSFSEPLPRRHDSWCQMVRSDQHRTETQLRPQQPLQFVEVLW